MYSDTCNNIIVKRDFLLEHVRNKTRDKGCMNHASMAIAVFRTNDHPVDPGDQKLNWTS